MDDLGMGGKLKRVINSRKDLIIETFQDYYKELK
jgi:hypothetical protein